MLQPARPCRFPGGCARPVQEYLDDIFGENILQRTLGIAALNALERGSVGSNPRPRTMRF